MSIVPKGHQDRVSTSQGVTSNAASLPDTLRMQEGGAVPLSSQLNDRHPLMHRVQNWEETQHRRQLEQYRYIFGLAEPMRRMMEIGIVDATDFNPVSQGQSSIHRDILMNKETSVDWEDIYPENNGLLSGNMVGDDVHTQIERKVGI